MRNARGGYTVIEVMMVLAVSGALLISAAAVFRGKQGQTQFNQAMRDLDSKIQSYISDVGAGIFPEAEQYLCQLDSATNRPHLVTGTQVAGSNQDCIFLGKAIETAVGSNKIAVYTVLGNRTYISGGSSVPVTEFSQSRPEPAIYNGAVLMDEYKIAFDAAELVYAMAVGSTIPPGQEKRYEIAGFYNSLQTQPDPSQQGSQSLLVKTYRTNPPPAVVTTKQCIEEDVANCRVDTPNKWSLCFKSKSSNDYALLVITPTSAGVGTELIFKPDPGVCPG